jgi:hypothetical protein
VIALCALVILGLSIGVFGCSLGWASSSGAQADSAAVVNQAIYQLQAVLGLADGAISRSSQAPMLANSDVALTWVGGRADVDLESGRLRAVLLDMAATADTASTNTTPGETTPSTDTGAPAGLSVAQLDKEADRVMGLLGWDPAALETHGFIEGTAQTVSYHQLGSVYEKVWVGHDPEGVANQAMLQVGLDTRDGSLHSFLFSAGPETALDMTKTISKDAAIKTAKEAAGKTTFLNLPTTATTKATTTTTTKKNKTTTTATTAAAATDTATMVHIDKPAITGGKDMLVWVVRLAADPITGRAAATVYVDAVGNKPLLVVAA